MVVWSWLTFPSVCLITELASRNLVGCFIAGYGGNFRKLLTRARRRLKSFHYTPRNSGQVTAVHLDLPLKRWDSRTLLHSAHSRSRKWAACVVHDWIAHEVDPSLASATPRVACTLRRRFSSSLAHWCRFARREAGCVRDGTLFSSSRKESSRTKPGISDDRRRSSADLPRRRGCESPRKHHPRADQTFAIAAAWLVITVGADGPRCGK